MKRFILFFILFVFLLGLYSRYIEINMFTINEYSIESDVTSSFEDLKIVHFSDTLINEMYTVEDLSSLVDEINALNPDLIFFTGDLIDNDYSASDEEYEEIINLLGKLDVSLYKFSVYGDNDLDNAVIYADIMDSSDFILLDNETFTLFYKDVTPITITGITDLTQVEEAYDTEIDTSQTVNLSLTHYPDNFSSLDNADIVFAGHYLGGYISIPFIGTVYNKNNASIYHDEYTNINEQSLYLSNGLGTENYHYRLNNIPSINVYKFV